MATHFYPRVVEMRLVTAAGFSAQSDGVLNFIGSGIRNTNGDPGTVNALFGLWPFGGDLPQQT
jgi:hypothetical protein